MPMIVDGTTYHDDTPAAVVQILEQCRTRRPRTRIRLCYGETSGPNAGQDWGETYDVAGYVGRSCGPTKIPLLIHNSRSLGGGGILTHCIVSIQESRGGRILYRHPNYRPPVQRLPDNATQAAT